MFRPHSKVDAVNIKCLAKECQISLASGYRLLKEPLHKVTVSASRKGVGGRKKKITNRAESLLLRKIPILRKSNANWTASDLMALTGIEGISLRTVQSLLNRNGYHHLKARRKGILSSDDAKKRLSFARKMKKKETARSIRVVIPRYSAKPLTVPLVSWYRTPAPIREARSAQTMVENAALKLPSAADLTARPRRTSSLILS